MNKMKKYFTLSFNILGSKIFAPFYNISCPCLLVMLCLLMFWPLPATSSKVPVPPLQSIYPLAQSNRSGENCNKQIAKCPTLCSCYCNNKEFIESISMFQNRDMIEGSINEGFTTSCNNVGVKMLPLNVPNKTRTYLLDSNSINSSVALGFVFDGMRSDHYERIQTISLRENNLDEIDPNTFQNFQALNTLILSHNLISNCSWIAGLTSTRLQYLDLSHNRITTFSSDYFGKNNLLKRLDLNHNAIGSVERSAFDQLTSLQYLDLSANSLKNSGLGKNSFRFLQALQYLSIANNGRLTNLPNFENIGLSKVVSLRELDLHGLRYVTVVKRRTFAGLQNLQVLNLSSCSIKSLEYGWLDGGPDQALKTLDLSRNRFETIEQYNLVGTTSHIITDSVTDHENLDLNSLPYVVTRSIYVQASSLTPAVNKNNVIPSLDPKHYTPLSNLTWLSLGDNFNLLHLAENSFNFLPKLEYLFLQNCNISMFKIASAMVQYANDAIPTTLPNLRGIWVFGNPMLCDCYARALLNAKSYSTFTESSLTLCSNNTNSTSKLCNRCTEAFTIDAQEYFYEDRCLAVNPVGNATCFFGYSTRSRPITEVPLVQLFCPQEPLALFVAMSIGPIAFALSILLALSCGFCTVLIQRVQRYKSGVYYLMNKEQELKEKDAPASGTSPHVVRKNHMRQTHRSRSPAVSRHRYGTNMVLGNMGSRSGASPSLPFFNSLMTSSRPPSPSPMSRRKKFKQLKSSRKDCVDGIPLQDMTKRSLSFSNSCPDVSEVETRREYRKHSFTGEQNDSRTFEGYSEAGSKQLDFSFIDDDRNAIETPSNTFLTVPEDSYLNKRKYTLLTSGSQVDSPISEQQQPCTSKKGQC